MISKRLLLVVALVIAGGLGACGKGDVKPGASGEPTETEVVETTTTTAAAEEPAAAASITLTGTEYAYAYPDGEGPAPIPAGPVTVTLENEGVEEHQISIVKLKPGKTQDDFLGLATDISQFDDVLETWGGPNGVAPGDSNTTTQVLEAGDYFFACFIPSADEIPHIVNGMLLPVTVEGELPEPVEGANDPITMSDYSFGLSKDAAEPTELSGSNEWRFVNDGPQPHEAAIYAPAEGSTMQDIVDYLASPAPEGPPPFVGAGGIGPIDVGRDVIAGLDPGEYVFMCFIPDAADGLPHFLKGMIEFATVT